MTSLGQFASRLARERAVALDAVKRAMRVCSQVQHQLVAKDTEIKEDASPVTVADYSAQAVINTVLRDAFPDVRIVGEESAQGLCTSQDAQMVYLRERITQLANSVLDRPRTTEELLDAINLGAYAGGPHGRHWTLDPVDGTKGFLRGGQYAICLALIEDGIVHLGVVGCPNLPVQRGLLENVEAMKQATKHTIFVAVRGEGAYQCTLEDPTEHPIQLNTLPLVDGHVDFSQARFCESWEPGHSDQHLHTKIADLLGLRGAPARLDSQCKYAVVARGEADIYLRLPVRPGYIEKIWDHAAGSLLVEEVGGRVTDANGRPLDFSRGRLLTENRGVVVAHAQAHAQVLAAVQKVMSSQVTSHQ